MDLLIGFQLPLFVITIAILYAVKHFTKDSGALTAKFKTSKTLDGSIEENISKISYALNNAGFHKVGNDKESLRVYAYTGFSFSSFSEYIEVKLLPNENSSSIIYFKSICALPTQMIDWGKNRRNYKRFLKELEKIS
ncbi:hypothetical protein KMW28_09730 [Flammeovirga yaeyamensis]|uniref:Uncharacterized protein n=1 Tax=Flammeovirga yaeyamensis TaxID=367791 RepID=A0AAX1N8D6_9BACT|nr:hypothetical protein [Flammeovirga yaeyamensis]MBB3698765.1 hypothetical protein [Flammeovirga yaeyamensis]NMF37350.1 hypothetical protein [Flammeovirga yaeyamensis]QWG03834.1 hypothetical protein KMW28_09730 [Flammeovirga yaeyamensis]